MISQKTEGNTVQAYFIIPDKENAISSYKIKMFNVEGGIGGQLIGPEGISLNVYCPTAIGKNNNCIRIEDLCNNEICCREQKRRVEIN